MQEIIKRIGWAKLTEKLPSQKRCSLQQSVTSVQVGLVSNGGQDTPRCSLGTRCAMRSLFADSARRSLQLANRINYYCLASLKYWSIRHGEHHIYKGSLCFR